LELGGKLRPPPNTTAETSIVSSKPGVTDRNRSWSREFFFFRGLEFMVIDP
jgi:hypothetical protein